MSVGSHVLCVIEPRKLETELPETLMDNAQKLRKERGWATHVFSPVHMVAKLCDSAITIDSFVVEDQYRGFGYTSGVIIGVERFASRVQEVDRAEMVVIPAEMERDEASARQEFDTRDWTETAREVVLVAEEANADAGGDAVVKPAARLTYEKQFP